MNEALEKKGLAEEAARRAKQYELDYGSCPQCVLAAIQETVGGIDDATIKAVHGLAGGLVALSTKRGRDRDKMGKGRYMANYQKGKELVERFRAEFGGVTCEELQQKFTGRRYDMWQADEYQAFDRARGEQCANATATVTRWVVEML